MPFCINTTRWSRNVLRILFFQKSQKLAAVDTQIWIFGLLHAFALYLHVILYKNYTLVWEVTQTLTCLHIMKELISENIFFSQLDFSLVVFPSFWTHLSANWAIIMCYPHYFSLTSFRNQTYNEPYPA